MDHLATAEDVVAFWREAGPDKWFSKDEAFDETCRARFVATYEAAARGDLAEWELSPQRAPWLSPSCSINFRATCSAARAAPTRRIRPPF